MTSEKPFKILVGDCLRTLKTLPAKSVQCCITSPPYFGLRDYQTGKWEGGDPDCDHNRVQGNIKSSSLEGGKSTVHHAEKEYKKVCKRCGAKRVDRQIGQEQTPEEYVANLVAVFREVRRVLRDDGTVWVNLGSTYCSKRMPSQWYTMREDLSDEEYRAAIRVVEKSFRKMRMSMRQLQAFSKQAMSELLQENDETTKGNSTKRCYNNQQMQNVRKSGQSVEKQNKKRDGGVLQSGMQVEGDSSKQEGEMHSMRKNITKTFQRDKKKQNGEPLLQPEMLVREKHKTRKKSIAKTIQREQDVEKGGPGAGQVSMQKLPRDGGSSCTSYSSLRGLPRKKMGRDKRDNAVLGMSQISEGEGASLRRVFNCAYISSSRIVGGVIVHRDMIPLDCLHLFQLASVIHPKNDLGIPWRFAFAMQADGWILRDDIIWYAPGKMPQSVTDRTTKAHEYVFLLAKQPRYFYDAEAIKERSKTPPHAPKNNKLKTNSTTITGRRDGDRQNTVWAEDGLANKRSVWVVNTEPLCDAHFAAFPTKLVLPMILAGTSEKGCCPKCRAPYRRKVKKIRTATRPGNDTKMRKIAAVMNGLGKTSMLRTTKDIKDVHAKRKLNNTPGLSPVSMKTTLGSIVGNRDPERHVTQTKTVGWEPTCDCNAGHPVPRYYALQDGVPEPIMRMVVKALEKIRCKTPIKDASNVGKD